jgi:hypothetical protein
MQLAQQQQQQQHTAIVPVPIWATAGQQYIKGQQPARRQYISSTSVSAAVPTLLVCQANLPTGLQQALHHLRVTAGGKEVHC